MPFPLQIVMKVSHALCHGAVDQDSKILQLRRLPRNQRNSSVKPIVHVSRNSPHFAVRAVEIEQPDAGPEFDRFTEKSHPLLLKTLIISSGVIGSQAQVNQSTIGLFPICREAGPRGC